MLGWAALVVGGPPAYLAIAWLGEKVIAHLLPRPSPKRFSVAWFGMMGAAVAVGCALLAIDVWLALKLDR